MSSRTKRSASDRTAHPSAALSGSVNKDDERSDPSDSVRKKRRCGKCKGCLCKSDCGSCVACLKNQDVVKGTSQVATSLYPCLLRKCDKIHGSISVSKDEGRRRKIRPSSLPETSTSATNTASDPSLQMLKRTAAEAGVPPENFENWKTLNKFNPTAYLLLDDDLQSTANKSTTPHKTPNAPMNDLYGLPIPNPPIENVCSTCLRRTDIDYDESNPILLCDGCDREYHLRCLQPRYAVVPEGDFYCWDCSPTGTTASLQAYLEQVDQERSKHPTRAAYVATLQERLLSVYNKSLGCRKPSKFSVQDYHVPESELHLEHIQKVETAIHSSEQASASPASPSLETVLAMEVALGHDFLVGKPIDLFFNDPQEGDRLHSGRIVDCRTTSDDGVEYYVRFPAGADFRKTPLAAWIALEEHVITVETSLVWIEEKKTQWIPAIVQLRSVLSLIMLHRSQAIPEPESPARHSYRAANPKRERISAWTKTFGDRAGLIERDMKSKAMPFVPDGRGKLSQLAAIEWHEQQRVRDWRQMKQINPYGYRALTSRDDYELEALIPINHFKQIVESHAEPCPLVPRGLDRLHIAQLMRRGGEMEPTTKDVASTLSCKISSMSSSLCSDGY